MHDLDTLAESSLQCRVPVEHGGEIDCFALLDQRADPIGALAAFHCLGNWTLPLIDRDEPRFAEASREMRERGDYLIPRFNGEHRFDKPPLIYWLQAGAYTVLGENEFAARLPSALCAAAIGVVLALWGARLWDAATGSRAALIFSLCLQTLIHARAAVADMPMILGVTLAAWAGWEWRTRGSRREAPWSRCASSPR